MHSSGSRARNVDTLFFMHWWDRYRSHKKLGRTQYAKLVFLHPVGSACHVLHSGASVAQNINTLFFILEWDRYGFQKEHARTRYAKLAFLHPVWICGSRSAFRCVCGVKYQCTIFLARVVPERIPQKVCRDTLRRTCVFISGGICGSRSAFRCIQGAKCGRIIFHARLGPVQIPQKTPLDTLRRNYVFASVGFAGDVVHFGAFGARNVYA
jgi:hypothetical protein